METQFRPYGMAIQLTETIPSGITLVDSGGNELDCNYISVQASGSLSQTFFRVCLDPGDDITKLTTPVSNSLSAGDSLGITTSAIVGGYASVNNGIVEYLLSDSDRASIIYIGINQNAATNFWITYGQIQAGNILRDNNRPIGS